MLPFVQNKLAMAIGTNMKTWFGPFVKALVVRHEILPRYEIPNTPVPISESFSVEFVQFCSFFDSKVSNSQTDIQCRTWSWDGRMSHHWKLCMGWRTSRFHSSQWSSIGSYRRSKLWPQVGSLTIPHRWIVVFQPRKHGGPRNHSSILRWPTEAQPGQNFGGGKLRVEPKPRARSARELRNWIELNWELKPEPRAKPEIKRGGVWGGGSVSPDPENVWKFWLETL